MKKPFENLSADYRGVKLKAVNVRLVGERANRVEEDVECFADCPKAVVFVPETISYMPHYNYVHIGVSGGFAYYVDVPVDGGFCRCEIVKGVS